MLVFSGTAYTKDDDVIQFQNVRAKSEAEAKQKVKAKYAKRKKPVRIQRVDLEYVDLA